MDDATEQSTLDRDRLRDLLAAATDIALEAGRAILPIAREVGHVEEKADGSPLTRADRASHEVIVAGLAQLVPEMPILSEEGDLDTARLAAAGRFWCVDPLDGTKEFVRGLEEYTVNIALVESARPILGVIYAPALDALYTAARGCGAHARRPSAAAPQALAPSRAARPRSAVASRSHLSSETEAFLQQLGITETAAHGSSIKMCAVAEGRADVYPRFGPTCLWDTAAGTAIAREAGCRVIDLSGEPLDYDPAAGLKRPGFIVVPRQMDLGPLPEGGA